MSISINTNLPSLNTQRHLGDIQKELDTSMERLSSGKRINSASDDAAGLKIATRLDTQAQGLEQGSRNALDGISVSQTAEGSMEEVVNMLQKLAS